GGETEGTTGGLPSPGGTEGSGLCSSRPIASVAEFNAAVEPGRPESGLGTTPGSWPGRAPEPPGAPAAGARAAAEIVVGAAEDEPAWEIGLEAFIDTTISGTAATAASRVAAARGPTPGRGLPMWKRPTTTATNDATWSACRTGRWGAW